MNGKDYDGNCKYQVIFIDEYNNFYLIGFYNNLKDAEEDVNNEIQLYKIDEYSDDGHGNEIPKFGENENQGPLTEYTSTFGPCFDRIIDVEEGCIQIRGFIFR